MPLLFTRKKHVLLALALSLLPIIAFADWRVSREVPLGLLYLLPMVLMGALLRPWQTLLMAALCTTLAELFDGFDWDLATGAPRDALYFAAFTSVGIYVYNVGRQRRLIAGHLRETERQSMARQEAEEQLHVLIESSPAAMLMADAEGRILMANGTAHRLLELPQGKLPGRPIQFYFPALASFARRRQDEEPLRVVVQARGHRESGEDFLADICFARYSTSQGPRMAATVLDLSEDLRTREEASLQQMLSGSRIAIGALSHEIRNICGAISVVHQNLSSLPTLAGNADFDALGSLARALERLARIELKPYPEQRTAVDLRSVLDDVRIIVAPSLTEGEIECAWLLPQPLPMVVADRTNLLQLFLNLINNSVRALGDRSGTRSLSIAALTEPGRVIVEVVDNAGGVAHPAELFRPFQAGARSTGLGLYLSRAFARAFGGELRYRDLPGQSCFVVELLAAGEPEPRP